MDGGGGGGHSYEHTISYSFEASIQTVCGNAVHKH